MGNHKSKEKKTLAKETKILMKLERKSLGEVERTWNFTSKEPYFDRIGCQRIMTAVVPKAILRSIKLAKYEWNSQLACNNHSITVKVKNHDKNFHISFHCLLSGKIRHDRYSPFQKPQLNKLLRYTCSINFKNLKIDQYNLCRILSNSNELEVIEFDTCKLQEFIIVPNFAPNSKKFKIVLTNSTDLRSSPISTQGGFIFSLLNLFQNTTLNGRVYELTVTPCDNDSHLKQTALYFPLLTLDIYYRGNRYDGWKHICMEEN
ncbi:unnamed protein product [Moneuplotes crassus]|uniref:Uncharacterized protein n=1 Tax=Euplotes crassus TaxID=5936 RepID=A0AAD1XG63_EUPCR|nr:unnamed protein product [Moneuplotes crassus]